MDAYKLGEMEQRFAELIWQHQPISSRRLAELCQESFGWKRTTSYTMLKRLCQRGLFENQGGTVRSLMSREEFFTGQGEQFLQQSFGGSLPQFVAAFARHRRLSPQELAQLQQLIDHHREE